MDIFTKNFIFLEWTMDLVKVFAPIDDSWFDNTYSRHCQPGEITNDPERATWTKTCHLLSWRAMITSGSLLPAWGSLLDRCCKSHVPHRPRDYILDDDDDSDGDDDEDGRWWSTMEETVVGWIVPLHSVHVKLCQQVRRVVKRIRERKIPKFSSCNFDILDAMLFIALLLI